MSIAIWLHRGHVTPKERTKEKEPEVQEGKDLRAVTEFLNLTVPDGRCQEDKPMNFIHCLTLFGFVFLPFANFIKKSSFRTKRKLNT